MTPIPQGAALSAPEPHSNGRPKGTPGGLMAGCTNSEMGAAAVAASWFDYRERCGHYKGIKEDDDEDQCTHPDRRSVGSSWCEAENCPRLWNRAAIGESPVRAASSLPPHEVKP